MLLERGHAYWNVALRRVGNFDTTNKAATYCSHMTTANVAMRHTSRSVSLMCFCAMSCVLNMNLSCYGGLQKEGKIGRWPGGITFQLLAVRPQSRGSVSLEAADITERPAIDLAYLSDKGGALPVNCRVGSHFSGAPAAVTVKSTVETCLRRHLFHP